MSERGATSAGATSDRGATSAGATSDRGATSAGATCDRGVTPVVEKILAIGIVLLFVGGTTSFLLGGAVPQYRAAVSSELGDRVLAKATASVEAAIPPNVTAATSRTAVDLPERIGGRAYRIVVRNRTLELVHPHRAVAAQSRLSLPDHVHEVQGAWNSSAHPVVAVTTSERGLVVRLQEETG